MTNSIASRHVPTQMSTEPVEPDISLHPIVVDVNEIKTSLETSILKGGGGCVGEEQDAEEVHLHTCIPLHFLIILSTSSSVPLQIIHVKKDF